MECVRTGDRNFTCRYISSLIIPQSNPTVRKFSDAVGYTQSGTDYLGTLAVGRYLDHSPRYRPLAESSGASVIKGSILSDFEVKVVSMPSFVRFILVEESFIEIRFPILVVIVQFDNSSSGDGS